MIGALIRKLTVAKLSVLLTVPLFADREYQFLSSSMVKEVDGLDKDISNYVHPLVKQKMLEKKLR